MVKKQSLNGVSYIVGKADMQAAAKIVVCAVDGMRARRKKQLWDATPGLYPSQVFQLASYIFSPIASETAGRIRWRI